MAKLSEKAKRAVIKRLAAFETPTAISRAISEQFGVELARQSVEYYDPTKNEKLASHYVQYWKTEREKFIQEVDAQPLNHLAFRQKLRLQQLHNLERNPLAKLKVLDSAAKDARQVFSEHQRIAKVEETTIEERQFPLLSSSQLADILRQLPRELLPADIQKKIYPVEKEGEDTID